MKYFIYGKTTGMRMFRPIDLQAGIFVKNLIYASYLDTKEQAMTVLANLNENNPGMKFEIRPSV